MLSTTALAYEPRPYEATAVPARADLHLLNRMGCGFSVDSFNQLLAAGGAATWFERQLSPLLVEEDPLVSTIDSWFPHRADSAATRFENVREGRRAGWQYAADLVNWTTLRRIHSRRTVFETMVDFWSHHFHIPVLDDQAWPARGAFDSVIRTHALGRFDLMLAVLTLHPAMLLYLDNCKSVRDNPNENHGRELLELHTVGRGAGYTEQEVRDSAVILSGWTVNRSTFARHYQTARHTVGPVEVLGFRAANDSTDGRTLTADYLRHLAYHPATARHLARKLVTRFVGDYASDTLVNQVAATYLASETRIAPTLRFLVSSEEFKASYAAKVRTPVDDLVATARVLQVRPTHPTGTASYASQLAYAHGCDALFGWPRPDGAPLADEHWCTPGRMLGSFRMHWNLAGGLDPTADVIYRKPASWLPKPSIAFDLLVDHLSRLLLGRPVTAVLLQAACEATGLTPATVVDRYHPLVTGGMTPLLSALLDSPAHLRR